LWLTAIALVITALGAFGQWLKYAHGVKHSFGFIHQFGPDDEANIATWFSSTVMLGCAAFLAYIGHRAPSGWWRRRWWALAVILLVMSIDETAQLHEMSIECMRGIFGSYGPLHFAWVVPGAAFAATVAIVFFRFLKRLPNPTRWLFVLAGLTYVSGALGMEMIDGWYAGKHGVANLGYAYLTVIEEGLENAGLILFTYSLCSYVHRGMGAQPAPPVAPESERRQRPFARKSTGHFGGPTPAGGVFRESYSS
jgi:hypothetical protein